MINVEYNNFYEYLDWINLMTYDFHVVGMYYHGSNYNAGLYSSPKDPSPEPSKSKDNIDGAVKSLIDFGVPKEKIMVGVGSYGRGWAGVDTPPFSNYTGAPYGTW
jgi:chitinase